MFALGGPGDLSWNDRGLARRRVRRGTVEGALLTFSPLEMTATTDASGAFTVEVPIGVHLISIGAEGYQPFEPRQISVVAGATSNVMLELVPLQPLSVSAGPDQEQVGFDTAVSLSGSASGGSAALTYAWVQTGGPPVALSGADTANASFTTQTIEAVYDAAGRHLPERSGVLAIPPRLRGAYTFRLTVSENGYSASDTVVVNASFDRRCAGPSTIRCCAAHGTTTCRTATVRTAFTTRASPSASSMRRCSSSDAVTLW